MIYACKISVLIIVRTCFYVICLKIRYFYWMIKSLEQVYEFFYHNKILVIKRLGLWIYMSAQILFLNHVILKCKFTLLLFILLAIITSDKICIKHLWLVCRDASYMVISFMFVLLELWLRSKLACLHYKPFCVWIALNGGNRFFFFLLGS